MKKLKKLTTLLLSVMLIVGLVSCGTSKQLSSNENSNVQSQENNDSGIKKITLKLDKKEETRIDENSKANENTTETIENKIVSEIQKIQKVEVKVGNNTKENSTENENSKITKTDIESVKEFLISEYGVSKSCLKIN